MAALVDGCGPSVCYVFLCSGSHLHPNPMQKCWWCTTSCASSNQLLLQNLLSPRTRSSVSDGPVVFSIFRPHYLATLSQSENGTKDEEDLIDMEFLTANDNIKAGVPDFSRFSNYETVCCSLNLLTISPTQPRCLSRLFICMFLACAPLWQTEKWSRVDVIEINCTD